MAITLQHSDSAPAVRPPQASDYPSVSVTHAVERVVTSSASDSEVTVDDVVYDRHTTADFHDEGMVTVSGMAVAALQNLTPAVADVDAYGNISPHQSGVLSVIVKGVISKRLDIDLATQTAATVDVFNRLADGSAGKAATDWVDSRINSGMTMAANGLVYTTQDHATSTYVRNPSLWCADADLTCISPWNSDHANKKAGTLVTARHVINAAHYEFPVGTTLRFVANDNTVHERTVTGKKRHPDYSAYVPDLTIYTLDADLPAAITPCKLMPPSVGDYITKPTISRIPALGLDQDEKALIIDWAGGGSFSSPTDADRAIFHETKISGDSGNPAFLVIGGELLLITVWTFGGAGSGTPVADYIPDINQMIGDADTQAGVSTGYTVTEADFSQSFPDY